MIRSFRSLEAERIWLGEVSRKLPIDIQATALRKLRMLNNAVLPRDLAVPPNNGLEAMKHDRKGQYSMRVNDQWCICFRWTEGGPADVDIVDYH